jgi:hypothetical protein
MVCSPTSYSYLLESSKLTHRSDRCGIYFQRIVELEEVDQKPTPPEPESLEPSPVVPSSRSKSSPQRRVATSELDFSEFTRIRIILKQSRVRLFRHMPFTCTSCQKSFRCRPNLMRHRAAVHDRRRLTCGGTLRDGQAWGCGKSYCRADGLARHLKGARAGVLSCSG